MTLVLSWSDRRTKMGVLMLDVLLTEEIDFASQVTLYPVEDGTTISDHVTQGVETVRLGGTIATATAAAFSFGVDPGMKLIDVIEALRQMHADRTLVTISTGQMIYPDMAFTTMNAQRSAGGEGGNWVSIKAELIKVRKVSLRTADVPAERTTAPRAAGRAGATNTPAGQGAAPAAAPADVSVLKGGADALLERLRGIIGGQ